jgi:hypothetical protein
MFGGFEVTGTHVPSDRCSLWVYVSAPYGAMPNCANFIAMMFAIAPTIAGMGVLEVYVPIAATPIEPSFQPYACPAMTWSPPVRPVQMLPNLSTR